MSGIRQSKKVGTSTTYYYADGTLLGEYNPSTGRQLIYLYDESGSMYGFTYITSGIEDNYYFIKNLQDDVIGLLNSVGVLIAQYRYDAWGKLLSVTNASGAAITSSTSIALINPIRYRGYYYDSETGFYYLKSRYYDPETCRFLNADVYVSTEQSVLSCNMFAYCENNPVIFADKSGTFVFYVGGTADLTAIIGISFSIQASFDDNCNWAIQMSLAGGLFNNTPYVGIADASAGGMAGIVWGADTVYDLEGYSTQIGAGTGLMEYGAIDGIWLPGSILSDGMQFGFGVGAGIDVHYAHPETVTVLSGTYGTPIPGIHDTTKTGKPRKVSFRGNRQGNSHYNPYIDKYYD